MFALNPSYLSIYSSKSQQGLLTSGSAQLFAFLPPQTFQNSDEMKDWEQKADESMKFQLDRMTETTLKEGLKKQYELSKRWFKDPNQAQAEYVMYYFHPMSELIFSL